MKNTCTCPHCGESFYAEETLPDLRCPECWRGNDPEGEEAAAKSLFEDIKKKRVLRMSYEQIWDEWVAARKKKEQEG